jgi:hypothetical protein
MAVKQNMLHLDGVQRLAEVQLTIAINVLPQAILWPERRPEGRRINVLK